MAEQFLDAAKIGAAIEQVCSEAVTDRVRVNSAKSCAQSGLADDPVDRLGIQRATAFGPYEIRRLKQLVSFGLRFCPRHF